MALMRVVVVGGGLSGLTAAFTLASRGNEVLLLEAATELGGQIRTRNEGGFVVEEGAEGFPSQREATRDLCEELGLMDRLLPQQVQRSLRLSEGQLDELQPGEAARMLGMAVDSQDLGAGLLTLRQGMKELTAALTARVKVAGVVETGSRVLGLTRENTRWQVQRADGGPVTADAVILALPPHVSESLLKPIIGDAPELLPARDFTSVTVTLAVPRNEMGHKLDATGFVADSGSVLRACSFSSSKFAHRAPAGWCLIRAFFRPDARTPARSPAEWIGFARKQLAPLLDFSPHSWAAWVTTWDRVFPQYPVDHRARTNQVLDRLSGMGIELAGAPAGLTGVDGAVRSGRAAAQRALAHPRT